MPPECTFFIEPMSEQAARDMLSWRYDDPYDFYNADSESVEEDLLEALDGSENAVRDESGALIGFFAFGACAQVPGGHLAGAYTCENVLDIGLGLRPDLTGQGMGLHFLQAGLDLAVQTFHPSSFRLTVATFNRRAIIVYERAGFVTGPTIDSETRRGTNEFVIMTREV